MILKILKHEWKATYRTFSLLYLAVVLATVFVYGSMQIGAEWLQALSAIILSVGIIPVTVVYFVTVYNGYVRSMYGDEAYLTHTLPVKGRQVLLGKWAMASFWGILTVVVGATCGLWLLFMLAINVMSAGQLWGHIEYTIRLIGAGNIAVILVMIILTCIQFLVKVYFAVAVSKLPFITRFNGLIGLLVFMAASYIQNKIYYVLGEIIPTIGGNMYFDTASADILAKALVPLSSFHIIFTIIVAVIYFAATSYVLERRLHIK